MGNVPEGAAHPGNWNLKLGTWNAREARTSRSGLAGKSEAEFGARLAVGHIHAGTHGVG